MPTAGGQTSDCQQRSHAGSHAPFTHTHPSTCTHPLHPPAPTQFSKDTLVYFLGASDAKTMMNGINRANLATAVMLPCGLRLGASGAVAGVRFASKAAAAECAGAFTVT